VTAEGFQDRADVSPARTQLDRRPRFLLTFLAWASSGVSGGDRHLLDVASRWREHVDIAVLAPPQAFPTIESFLGTVPMHPLGRAGPREAGRGAGLALEYLRRAWSVSTGSVPASDVVVTASHFMPDALALSAAVRQGAYGVAYVYHLVAERRHLDARTVWSKSDERLALAALRRYAGLVFVSNRGTAASLAHRGFNLAHTDVGVDLKEYSTTLPRRLQGLFLARMVDSKGVEDAMRAWAHVVRAVPEAKLVMAGEGPRRESAAALADRLGLGHAVEWRGFVSPRGPEKKRLLAESMFLLAPSYEEGFGLSVCEALASGLCVVAYDLPTLKALFGDAYLGARLGDVTELASLCTRVLTDDVLAKELASRGRKTAERYDIGRVAKRELDEILRRSSASAARQ
jgi:glycosyltransferase involved in cell wall biosynthesis